jgi:hypothetical protein
MVEMYHVAYKLCYEWNTYSDENHESHEKKIIQLIHLAARRLRHK